MISSIRLSLLVAAALASFTLGAPSASAFSRMAPAQSMVVPAGGVASATVRCPAGTIVTSGGFSSPDFGKEISSSVRVASLRSGKRAWRVDAAGLSQGTGTVFTYGYCSRRPGPTYVRKARTTVLGGEIGSATALCRKGDRSVGGGFSSPGFMLGLGPHAVVLSSLKSGRRGWRVEAVNPSFGDSGPNDDSRLNLPAPLVAYAYCRDGGPRVITRAARTTVAGEEVKQILTFCPRGTEAVSGGFDGHITSAEPEIGASGAEIGASGAVDSVRLPFGVGWRNTVISVSDQVPAKATGYSYCQRTGP